MAVNYPNDANIIERTASQLRTSDMSFSGYGGGSYLKTNFSDIREAIYGDYILVLEEQLDGVDGGTATSGSFQQRILNSVYYDDAGVVSLAANIVTLSPGLYDFVIFATTGAGVGVHQACLWETDEVDVLELGQVANDGNVAIVNGFLDITAATDVEVRHRVSTTVATTGWGSACSFGEGELYTQLRLKRYE